MSEDQKPYPNDPQTQRTRYELWAILGVALVVVVASLAWRAIGHHPAAHEAVWGHGAGSVPAGVPANGVPGAGAPGNGGSGNGGSGNGIVGVPAAAAAHPTARTAP